MTLDPKAPPRGPLPPDVVRAAEVISRVVWKQRYILGEGPMHKAGGRYWHDELLRLADQWERWAKLARKCAEVLPDGDAGGVGKPPPAHAEGTATSTVERTP